MKTILIVDDQEGIRLLLQEVFDGEGVRTVLAANGREALERVRTERPAVVLLDMKIPGMDGLEILKKLKVLHPEAIVIMMTAYGERGLIEEALNSGASLHFTKPFDVFELLETVKGLL